jgi:hypothetical protein
MAVFHLLGLSDALTREVRETRQSPGYGHPVVREVAGGTGPCRACLEQFMVGKEERLLFTYRPASREGMLGAPGPVFIHARDCRQYRGTVFPPGLGSLPLLIEAWAIGNRILSARRISGAETQDTIRELLEDPHAAFLHVRHGEAGCHIASVDRGPLPSRPEQLRLPEDEPAASTPNVKSSARASRCAQRSLIPAEAMLEPYAKYPTSGFKAGLPRRD